MKTQKNDFDILPVITYARTSKINTKESQCGSIVEQLEAMRHWARFNQCKIIKEYKDECISGLDKNPPGLSHMLDDIKHALIDPAYIVVCNFSRITRNLEVYDCYRYVTTSIMVNTISLSESCTCIPELLDHECKFNCKGRLIY